MDVKVKDVLNENHHLKTRLLFEGMLVGILAGGVAIIYRLLLSNAETLLFNILSYIKGHPIMILGWFIALIIMAFFISKCLQYEPYISGSGIPQIEAEVEGKIDQCFYKVILAKMVGGTLSILSGLSLGREGPSIQLGAMVGKGVSRFFKRMKSEERYLLICGASSGLAAAFNAPLAGIMFALEEIHKNFSTSALISVMCASITGDFISRYVFGMSPSLHFVIEENLPLNDYYWVIIIGVIGGICGIIYNKSTMKTLQLYDKIPYLKKHQKVIIPILLSGILGLFIPTVLAGGHKLVEYLNSDHVLLSMLFIYLIVKFLFSIISFGSGAPGGIFFPLLILGSLIGAIIGKIALMCGVDEILFANFIIITMAAFFASIVRAPLTGIILIAEMCGTLKILLPIALASFIAYVIANMLGCEPIYESLLSRIVTKNQSDYYIEQKELVTFIVEMGSVLEGAKVKDVHLPRPCLFVSVVRGNKEYIPRGETEFHAGDEVIMLVDKSYYKMAKDELAQLFKESSD